MPDKATKIKQIRELYGLSQAEFAARLSGGQSPRISRGAVGNWELGKGIRLENLERIAAEFHVPLQFFSDDSPTTITTIARREPQPMPISDDHDGHQVDATRAAGAIAEFFARAMRPNCEAWQITTDLLDNTVCKPGSYVVVEIGRMPGLRNVVLAELRDAAGAPPIFVFRVFVGDRLITSSVTPTDTPVLLVDDDRVLIRGVVIAHQNPGV